MCDGDGHTEAIYIKYDDEIITYKELVNKFFDITKPLIYEEGQYSSKIWTGNEEEKDIVKNVMMERRIKNETIISSFQNFYKAETYHQQFEKKNAIRYLILMIGVILSLLPNLDALYYKTGALITITYILITLVERFTNVEVKEFS